MNKSQNKTYLLLGGNLEDVQQTFFNARNEISKCIGHISSKSKLYKSPPWGFESSHPFLNQVLELQTNMSAEEVSDSVLKIETLLGRIRSKSTGYSSRVIDIDILYFNDEIINKPNLIVPHPSIQDRRFTLLPLVDIIPNYIHPKLNISNQTLLDICADNSTVTKV